MKKVIKCAKSRKEMLGEGVEIEDICYVFLLTSKFAKHFVIFEKKLEQLLYFDVTRTCAFTCIKNLIY